LGAAQEEENEKEVTALSGFSALSGMEHCPQGKTCTAGSDANWKNIEQ